jgi:hypothetical protein
MASGNLWTLYAIRYTSKNFGATVWLHGKYGNEFLDFGITRRFMCGLAQIGLRIFGRTDMTFFHVASFLVTDVSHGAGVETTCAFVL